LQFLALMPEHPIPLDLKTDEGLRTACRRAGERVAPERVERLTRLLQRIRNADREKRRTRSFQRRVWADRTLWEGGLVKDFGFLDAEFCSWFASRTVEPLPERRDERVQFLRRLNDDALERIAKDGTRKPWIESLRTLALFFPEDFTGLAYKDWIVGLSRDLGRSVRGRNPVRAHRLVLDRLREVIGAPADGMVGTAERMLLVNELSRLSRERSRPDPPEDDRPTIWVVRAGEPDETNAEDSVLSKGLAMIGFADLPAPETDDFRSYRTVVHQQNPEQSLQGVAGRAAQVWKFAREMRPGDIVILPRRPAGRRIAWGTVGGKYEHREVDGQHRHTRPVKWMPAEISRSDFTDPGIFDRPQRVYPIDSLFSGLGRFAKLWGTMARRAGAENLRFERSLVEALHLGLWADEQRHFAVLSGLSGTGKTQVALRYAMALTGATSDTGGPVEVIAVHPGWHDPGPLLGYVNPLTGGYARTEFLNFLLEAAAKPDETHVLILDEMNLSHPEQYFAPILSAMEIADGEIPLHRGDPDELGVPTGVAYPKNLVLIGTVNMDETTMGISDKVLDRAFTLEFWDIEPEEWPGWESCELDEGEKRKVRSLLAALTKTLSPARRHFGWRVISEVVGFLEGRSGESVIEIGADTALDQVIYAKVLPKLRGSDTPRFRKCLEETVAVLSDAGLDRSATKVRGLQEDLEATGSCSFWR